MTNITTAAVKVNMTTNETVSTSSVDQKSDQQILEIFEATQPCPDPPIACEPWVLSDTAASACVPCDNWVRSPPVSDSVAEQLHPCEIEAREDEQFANNTLNWKNALRVQGVDKVLSNVTSQLTAAAWIKMLVASDSTTNFDVVSSAGLFAMSVIQGKLSASFGEDVVQWTSFPTWSRTSASPVPGVWTHLAVSMNTETGFERHYINGKQIAARLRSKVTFKIPINLYISVAP